MRVYIRNTIILAVCIIVSKIVGAIYKILLSNILGTQGIGLYQLVFPVYSLFLVFVTGGMPTYISQKVSFFRATNKHNKIESLINNSIVLCLVFGIVFCTILCVFGRQLAILQGNQMAYLGYITVAVSILFSVVTCVYRGYFMGYENMKPNAISNIFEQFAKLVFGLLLAFVLKPYGLIYAVSGAFWGVLFSEIISFLYMFFAYKKVYKKVKTFFSYKQCQQILKGFLPISLASFIFPLSLCIDSFLVVNMLTKIGVSQAVSTSLFGIATGMVNPLVNFPVLLCGTVATAILPSFTIAVAKKQNIKELIQGTYFFVWLVSLPCAVGILALAPNIISVCFPAIEVAYFDISVWYLSILSFDIVYLSVMQISTSILNGSEKFYLPLVAQSIGFVIKVTLFVILILFTNISILALAFAIIASNSLSCLITLYFAKRTIAFDIKLSSLLVPVFSSVAMLAVVLSLNKFLKLNEYLKLGVLVFVGMLVYFLICGLFKIISFADVKKLLNKNTKSNLS